MVIPNMSSLALNLPLGISIYGMDIYTLLIILRTINHSYKSEAFLDTSNHISVLHIPPVQLYGAV